MEEPEDTPEDMSVYTKTEGGVTVSISEAYCSVEAIYLSLMISSEEGFPDTMTDMEDKPLIHLEGTTEYSFSARTEVPATGTLEGKFWTAILMWESTVSIFWILSEMIIHLGKSMGN